MGGEARSPGRGTCRCKSPEAGLRLWSSRGSKGPSEAGTGGTTSEQEAMGTGRDGPGRGSVRADVRTLTLTLDEGGRCQALSRRVT